MSSTLASPAWQAVLFAAAALFLLWELWAGWRRGVVRSAVHFVAFVFSGIAGFGIGQFAGTLIGKVFPAYGFLIGLLIGSVLTLSILVVALVIGAILFKRTGQQSSGIIRFFYGAGGAFFGLLTALAILWGGITIIRAFGAIAESAVAGQPAANLPPVTRSLLKMKESLELGPAGEVVASVDVVPTNVYDTIARAGKLASDPDALMRFLDAPGIQSALQNPKITNLLNDPAVLEAAERRDFFALLQNPRLAAAAADPEVAHILMSIDLQKALDYALPPAQSSPTPAPKKP